MTTWLLKVTKPPMKGQRAQDMQWQLAGHNRFGKQTYFGPVDGVFGPGSGKAAKDMKTYLGYPTGECVATAGAVLRSYLLPKESVGARLLPADYLARKKQREPVEHYPLTVVGTIIGFPYQGTHTLGNWESDRASDIAAKKGTPVLACFAGTIGPQFGPLASSNPRLLGLRCHLVGATDEAYYAHLSSFAKGIQPGVKVKPGDVLGYSGVANGVAHLHWALQHGWPPSFLDATANV